MPAFGPIRRADLIFYFRRLGFSGPESGGKHQYMTKGTLTIPIPNPHQREISAHLLARILREGGIKKRDWEAL